MIIQFFQLAFQSFFSYFGQKNGRFNNLKSENKKHFSLISGFQAQLRESLLFYLDPQFLVHLPE